MIDVRREYDISELYEYHLIQKSYGMDVVT